MNKKDLVCEWLEHSKNDYISAKYLFEELWPRQINTSAYHCQQCVEKALKAYMVHMDIDPPYTHDLDILRDICNEAEPGFSRYKDDCIDLTEYAAQTRYPGGFDIPESAVKDAIEKACGIYGFVTGLVPELDEKLSIEDASCHLDIEL
jgi:HEPN domain-containing protein